jgi:hypothetical protein
MGGWMKFQYWSRILKMMLLHGARAQVSSKFFNIITTRLIALRDKAIPNQTIIEGTAMLLSYGLDPNKPAVQGLTFWTEFLQNFWTDARPSVVRSMEVHTLLQIFTLFLRYGADPAALDYSITGVHLTLYHKRIFSKEKPRSLCLVISKYKDDINKFVELIEREKAYHKSREFSVGGNTSDYKSQSTIPAKRKMGMDLVSSSFGEAVNLISTVPKRVVMDCDSLGHRLKPGYRISEARLWRRRTKVTQHSALR